MNLDDVSKDLLKQLSKHLSENEQKLTATHGDLFWAKYYNSSKEIRESPVLVIGKDNDKEDVIVIQGTKNTGRPDFAVAIDISYINKKNNRNETKRTAFRTNKIFTINRKDLDNKCSFDWNANSNKYDELVLKLKKSIGLES